MKGIIRPLRVIPKAAPVFWLWLICVLFLGQGGLVASIIGSQRGYLSGYVKGGGLLTFSLACLGASFFEFGREYFSNNENSTKFKGEKTMGIGFTILLIFVISIGLPFGIGTGWQVLLYLLSIMCASFVLCVSLLPDYYFDDYREKEDKNIAALGQSGLRTHTDEGAKI